MYVCARILHIWFGEMSPSPWAMVWCAYECVIISENDFFHPVWRSSALTCAQPRRFECHVAALRWHNEDMCASVCASASVLEPVWRVNFLRLMFSATLVHCHCFMCGLIFPIYVCVTCAQMEGCSLHCRIEYSQGTCAAYLVFPDTHTHAHTLGDKANTLVDACQQVGRQTCAWLGKYMPRCWNNARTNTNT